MKNDQQQNLVKAVINNNTKQFIMYKEQYNCKYKDSNGNTLLMIAIQNNNFDIVVQLLNEAKIVDNNKQTALMKACQVQQIDMKIISSLIEFNIRMRDVFLNTALIYACKNNIDLTAALNEELTMQNYYMETALHTLLKYQNYQLLLNNKELYKIEFQLCNNKKESPLHYLVKYFNNSSLKQEESTISDGCAELIQNQQKKHDIQPISEISHESIQPKQIKKGDFKLATLIIELDESRNLLFESKNNKNQNILMYTVLYGALELFSHIIKILLNNSVKEIENILSQQDIDGNSIMHYIARNKVESVQYFTQLKNNFSQKFDYPQFIDLFQQLHNIQNKDQLNILNVACQQGNRQLTQYLLQFYEEHDKFYHHNENCSPVMSSIRGGQLQIFEILQPSNCKYNYKNVLQQTALMAAAASNGTAFIGPLRHECNMRDFQQQTALMHAAQLGHLQCIKLLLCEAGLQDCQGNTALLLACSAGHYQVAFALIQHEISVLNKNGENAITVAIKCNHNRLAKLLLANSISENVRYETPLMACVKYNRPQMAFEMKDAFLKKQNIDGSTALMNAVKLGRAYFVPILIQEAKIQDDQEKTALIYAAALGRLSCVQQLVLSEAGYTDKEGKTALYHAIINNHIQCVMILAGNKLESIANGIDYYINLAVQNQFSDKNVEQLEKILMNVQLKDCK